MNTKVLLKEVGVNESRRSSKGRICMNTKGLLKEEDAHERRRSSIRRERA